VLCIEYFKKLAEKTAALLCPFMLEECLITWRANGMKDEFNSKEFLNM